MEEIQSHALKIISMKDSQSVQFIIMGDGPKKEEFEKYAKEKGVDCCFKGRVPYDEMCALIDSCDIVVNPITGGAAASIINKHADYAACGHDFYMFRAIYDAKENEQLE